MNEHDIHPTHSAARRSDSSESPARRVFARAAGPASAILAIFGVVCVAVGIRAECRAQEFALDTKATPLISTGNVAPVTVYDPNL
jgi:hypothetical protein